MLEEKFEDSYEIMQAMIEKHVDQVLVSGTDENKNR